MKIRILFAAVLALCLTSCASYDISQPKVNQIKKGTSTEQDLLQLFGPPDTKSTAFRGNISLDWYRSVGPMATAYLPIVGQFAGGFDFEVQQLSVIIGRDGRVLDISVYDSNGAVRADRRALPAFEAGVYGK